MFASAGKVHIRKGFMDLDTLLKDVHDMWDFLNERNVVFHFRFATHGTTTQSNTHPFRINDGLCVAHNGVLTNVTVPKDKDITDTEAFVQQYLVHFPDGFHRNKAYTNMIEEFIGYSKLVLLDSKGEITILNEKLGQWDTLGRWHSTDELFEKTHKPTSLSDYWERESATGYRQWYEEKESFNRPFAQGSPASRGSGSAGSSAGSTSTGSTVITPSDPQFRDDDDFDEDLVYCHECGRVFRLTEEFLTLAEMGRRDMPQGNSVTTCHDHMCMDPIEVCEECGNEITEDVMGHTYCQACWEKAFPSRTRK
jgi:hypothetical protein